MSRLCTIVLIAALMMAPSARSQQVGSVDLRPEIPATRAALEQRLATVQAAIAAAPPNTPERAIRQIEFAYLQRGVAVIDAGSIARVEEARAAGRRAAAAALRGLDRQRSPTAWAHAQALRAFFSDDIGPFSDAEQGARLALQVFTKQEHPLHYLEVRCAQSMKRLLDQIESFDQFMSSPVLALSPICAGLVFGDGQSLSAAALNKASRQAGFGLAAIQSEINPALMEMMLALDESGSARRTFQSGALLTIMTGARSAFLSGDFATEDLGLSPADQSRARTLRAQAEAAIGDGARSGPSWRANRVMWSAYAELFDLLESRVRNLADPPRPDIATIAPMMLDGGRGFVAYASPRGEGGAVSTSREFARGLFSRGVQMDARGQAALFDQAMASTAPDRWMSFYADRDFRFGIEVFRADFEAQWSAALRDAIRRAGARPGDRVLIVPDGAASMLPIGLLRDGVTGRTLLEDFELVMAPSVSVYRKASARAQRSVSQSLAVIAPPANETGLAFAEFEVASVGSQFGGNVVRPREKSNVLEALAGAGFWHFATHGAFLPEAPLQSGLQLPGAVRLTLADLTLGAGPIGAPRLVVLSACETGLFEAARDPDEFVGLPTGFLLAGAGGVVASLWPVGDAPTALLMAKFYGLVRNEGMTPPAALRAAQLWLKGAETATLAAFIDAEAARGAVSASQANALRADIIRRGEPTPFADPVFWGAFVFYGA